jgi:hypothetical protein
MTTPAPNRPMGTDRSAGLRGALAAAWRAITADLLNGYRPEKHYMRGPGPKWHARHGLDEEPDAGGRELNAHLPGDLTVIMARARRSPAALLADIA